ncbi:MAG: OmpA family protein [Giesbergeria sp.]
MQQQQGVLRDLGFQLDDDGWTLTSSGPLLFALDSDVVTPALRLDLERVGRALSKVGIERLRVEGHTDAQGSEKYNDQLSLRRANAVAEVLIGAGIAPEGLQVKGYGFSRPIIKNASGAQRQENRRVAIVVPLN